LRKTCNILRETWTWTELIFMNTKLILERVADPAKNDFEEMGRLSCSLSPEPDLVLEEEGGLVAGIVKRELHVSFETGPAWSPVLRFLPVSSSTGA